jgi:hypothetical protein
MVGLFWSGRGIPDRTCPPKKEKGKKMQMVLVRHHNVWTSLGVVSENPIPAEGESWTEWVPWDPPEGHEFTDGDRLYPSVWWPTDIYPRNPMPPAYVRENGEWVVAHGEYLPPWEMRLVGGIGLPDEPSTPTLRAVLDHIGWSNTPAWVGVVLAAIRDAEAAIVDYWGESVTIWVYRSLDRPHVIRPEKCEPEVYSSLLARSIPARNLQFARRKAAWEAARLCAASSDPEMARLIRTAYTPSVMETLDDEVADGLLVQAARTAMAHLSALCADRWKTWRTVRLPDGDPKEWTVSDCGRAAVARVSSWAAERPQDSISRHYDRRAGATELLAESGDVAIVPSGIRTDRTPRLSAAVAGAIERWGDAEIRRWWDTRGIAPWESLVRNGRVMHALEDPYDYRPDTPDNYSEELTRDTAEYLTRKMTRHLADLLGLGDEYEEELRS